MSSVLPYNSTYSFIEQKIRHLTASASEASLSSASIQMAVNTFYQTDFPYAIKIDQQRSVYKFLTIPNVDRYPVDVNNMQGFRAPVYFEGIQGNFFKNRDQLFNLYPRYPTQFQPVGGDGVTTSFTFLLFGNNQNPFPQPNFGILSTQVVIGGIDVNGNPIRVIDDGGSVVNSFGIGSNTTKGQLLFINQNNVGNNVYLNGVNVQEPAIPALSPLPIPSPPVPLTSQYCGTVNYVTTEITVNFPVAPAAGTMINVWAATYQVGRPYNLLFWNNELTIRPVPDNVYLCEVEVYQTPAQFMMTTDNPTLNQWAQYIAYGSAAEILRDRQDMEGVENLMEGFKRQEALVLERQAVEEIGQPNITLFNTTQLGFGVGNGNGYGGGGY
ncbi:hypothetical protein UFOVP256_2 [uncultured Caudovirales phage]|uniref:Uncharacterized protein n=1 Tax=uncultured Caudovirales phage TaxID=2100421 RepID=A0A6J5LGR2_9CAUD|nr:hypothetical protein UFOVP256_2 [uncultured Caudovirales phage]